jgi:hypothetical protein
VKNAACATKYLWLRFDVGAARERVALRGAPRRCGQITTSESAQFAVVSAIHQLDELNSSRRDTNAHARQWQFFIKFRASAGKPRVLDYTYSHWFKVGPSDRKCGAHATESVVDSHARDCCS